MVYLIDDKKVRQEFDYSWTNERFKTFSNFISCIYTLEDLNERAEEIFSENNIILYHESFVDQTNISKEAIDKRNKLNTWSKSKQNKIVYFSGSKNTREINENIAYIPVSILYSNLEIFLNKILNNEFNLDYLLFGENINIEKELNQKQDINLSLTFNEEPINPEGSTFFVRPLKKFISNPFLNFEEGILFSDVSDQKLSEKIEEWFNEVKFDNIFLPLCFGDILSDYNGLRLATHIRCSKNLNQLSNIYIYGFVGIDYLLQNEYFDVLKTRNVFLVPYSKRFFLESINSKKILYDIDDLSDEVKKINLNIPKNYEDSHSIVNEWAIYRWSKSIGLELNNELQIVFQNINFNIYFKYLKTINPVQISDIIQKQNLTIKGRSDTKILLIDDDVNKGWGEIFSYLFADINNIYFDYIDKNIFSNETGHFIHHVISKIKNDNINIVILDFRLKGSDFKVNQINEITSINLLKEIKKFNRGIQVIIFSATSKLWNLQFLQDSGADNFIIKESPNYSSTSFTKDIIENFLNTLKTSIDLYYLKLSEDIKKNILSNFSRNPLINYYPNDFRSLRGFQYQNILLNELDSICNILNTKNTNRFNHSMLMQFKIIECIIEIFIPEQIKKNKWLFYDNTDVKYFYKDDLKIHNINEKLFFRDKLSNKKVLTNIPSYEYNSARNKIDCIIEQKLNIDNKDNVHQKLNELVNYRNDFIHPKNRTNLKPLTSENILDWMYIIEKIISKI
jgi:hypothetical protein